MHAARALAAVLLTLGVVGPSAVAADREAFARTIAEKLIAGKAKFWKKIDAGIQAKHNKHRP